MLNLSHYRILTVGKIRKLWIKEGIAMYSKRLPELKILELRASTPQKEADLIQSQLKKGELLITLSEEGKFFSSIEFTKCLKENEPNRLAFVIGGADGLSSNIKASAYLNLSLSPMTIPHEMARLFLIEQIYRAASILQGSPYHKT